METAPISLKNGYRRGCKQAQQYCQPSNFGFTQKREEEAFSRNFRIW